nr:immunoglobulin light chain junction region [Macaca mulatta]
CLQDIQVPRTF